RRAHMSSRLSRSALASGRRLSVPHAGRWMAQAVRCPAPGGPRLAARNAPWPDRFPPRTVGGSQPGAAARWVRATVGAQRAPAKREEAPRVSGGERGVGAAPRRRLPPAGGDLRLEVVPVKSVG